jgi:cytoplasmic iron level regulating protein YaaA (DUF328/UPF0246 family)
MDASLTSPMKTLISPSKSVTERVLPLDVQPTRPLFEQETSILLSKLQRLRSARKLGAVLDISENLGFLNYERYRRWDDPGVRRSALWMYSGDVYNGLDAFSLEVESARRMQDDLLIISGLYGLVRPFDLVQPYRLEMRTRLQGAWGNDLHRFWGSKLASYIEKLGTRTVLVCASREYAKAVLPELSADITVVTPRFLQPTPNGLKEKSLFAKHARGTLARWVADNRVEDPSGLVEFGVDGYVHSPELSSAAEPVFLVPVDFSLLGRYTNS